MRKIIPDYDLHQLRVLVTRPNAPGLSLCEAIQAQGGQAIYFPTLAFRPPLNPLLFQRQIEKLDQMDWAIFISPQAVQSSAVAINQCWGQFPWQVKVATVGAGTANALKKLDIPVHCFPLENWSSKGLLNCPEFQSIAGKKIMIVRGEGGRVELADTLKERGAEVSHLIAYERCLPDIDVSESLALLKAHAIDVVVTASGESLENLKKLLQAAWSFLQFIPVIVISGRIEDLARELGFRKIILAKNASQAAILEVLSLIA